MVFCGQCGYQLGPNDTICPRCGAKTEIEEAQAIPQGPDMYNATEVSHAILSSPTQAPPSQPFSSGAQGPLVLGPSSPNSQMANEATTMMSSQMSSQAYAPPPAAYPGYPQQTNTGMYNYNASAFQQPYQSGQAQALAQLLAASRRGKITSLLLILFGLLFLIAAVIILLLNQQGVIFT